jgi:hypothetical protein
MALRFPCADPPLIAHTSQEFLYYEPRENDKHLSATLNNILQRPRRNTPKLVKQTYSVVSPGDLGRRKGWSLTSGPSSSACPRIDLSASSANGT